MIGFKMHKTMCSVWVFAAAWAAAMPAHAQLGAVGGVTGSVASGIQGTTQAAIPSPGGLASAGGLGQGRVGQDMNLNDRLSVMQDVTLSSQLAEMLPAATTLRTAATGFRSEGDFVAALHAAHNLNIPFEQIKAEMTGRHTASLRKAIVKSRPNLAGKAANDSAVLAERQSERDLRQAATVAGHDRVSTRIVSDDHLAARLRPMVPSGQTLSSAAAGFRNEEQFMSTLHAANNNGIAFTELKDRVTAGQSLSTAIQELKPGTDARAAANSAATADAQAKNDKVEASASAKANAAVAAR